MYVIVQRDVEKMSVHGPWFAKLGATVYLRRLEKISPESCYEVHRLIPEKTPPKSRT